MPTFKNEPRAIVPSLHTPLGRLHVYPDQKAACDDLNITSLDSSSYLAALNLELAVLKAFICSEPLVSKFTEVIQDAVHSQSGNNVTARMGYYDLRERVEELQDRIASLVNVTESPHLINDSPQTNVTIRDRMEAMTPTTEIASPQASRECSEVAYQVAMSHLMRLASKMPIEAFIERMPAYIKDIDKVVLESLIYQKCLLSKAEGIQPDPDMLDPKENNYPPECLGLLDGKTIGSPEYEAVLNSDSWQACITGFTHSDPKPVEGFLGLCDPADFSSEQEYYRCLAMRAFYVISPNGLKNELPHVTATTINEQFKEIIELYSETKEVDLAKCPSCNEYAYGVIAFKECLDDSEATEEFKQLYSEAKAPLSERKVKEASGASEWSDSDLVLILSYSRYMSLSEETKSQLIKGSYTFRWLERARYTQMERDGKILTLPMYRKCIEGTCPDICEDCVEFWNPDDPNNPAYIDCFLQKCLIQDCHVSPECNTIATKFGVGSREWQQCYVANNFNPISACQSTLEVFGRDSEEYKRCITTQVLPVGKYSQEQFLIDPLSELYPLSIIRDIFSDKEGCIECCGITDVTQYLECMVKNCMGGVISTLCQTSDETKANVTAFYKSLEESKAKFIADEKNNVIPWVDPDFMEKIAQYPNLEVLTNQKIIEIDGSFYTEDILLIKETGTKVRRLTKTVTPQDAIAAIESVYGEDLLINLDQKYANELIESYMKEVYDLKIETTKNSTESEPNVSFYSFVTKCQALNAALEEDFVPSPVLDNVVIDNDRVIIDKPFIKIEITQENNDYVMSTEDKNTGEKFETVLETPVFSQWNNTRIDCFRTLKQITPAAIENLILTDTTVRNILALNKISPLSEEATAFVKNNVICANNILADYLIRTQENFSSSDIKYIIQEEKFSPPPEIEDGLVPVSKDIEVPYVQVTEYDKLEEEVTIEVTPASGVVLQPKFLESAVDNSIETLNKIRAYLENQKNKGGAADPNVTYLLKIDIVIPEHLGQQIDLVSDYKIMEDIKQALELLEVKQRKSIRSIKEYEIEIKYSLDTIRVSKDVDMIEVIVYPVIDTGAAEVDGYLNKQALYTGTYLGNIIRSSGNSYLILMER